MSSDEKKKTYSEEEFALILRKASEIQVGSGNRTAGTGSGGLTLEEIQSIATEAGMDAEAVTRAASIVGALRWDEKSGLAAAIFGGPSKYHLDHEIPGQLPPGEMGRILEQIRRAAEHQGQASEVMGGVEWKTVGELSVINVNISPRGDQTSIQIVGDRGPAGGVTFIFPMMAAAILVGALGASFEPTTAAGIISLVTGTLGAGFLTARTIWVSGTKRFQKRLTHMMDALSLGIEKVAVSPPSEALPRGSDETPSGPEDNPPGPGGPPAGPEGTPPGPGGSPPRS